MKRKKRGGKIWGKKKNKKNKKNETKIQKIRI